MSGTTYTLAPTAYALPILHAAAHPSSTVAGLLLSSNTSAGSTNIEITDAYPLVHRYTSLSSTAELGLGLARAQASTDGKRIVGVYVAPAEGTDLGRAGEAILGALRSDFAAAIGMVLDNDKLATEEPAYNPTAAATVAFPASTVVAGTLKLVKSGVHQAVRDLDDHLDDARADWLGNVEAHQAIAALA